MAFDLWESLRNIKNRLTSVKPGETAQALQDRLGIGTGGITFKQAGQAVQQGTGAFVPSGTQPLTLGASGQVIAQPRIQPLPAGTQPISTQPQPLTVTPEQLQQKPAVQPTTQPVSTSVSGVQTSIQPQPQAPVQPTVSPEAQNLTKQIEETKTKIKGLQAAKTATEAGFTVSAYKEALQEKTPFEQYTEAVRKAQEPLVAAYTKYTDTLANLPKSTDEYANLAKQYGLSDLEGNIKDITGKAYGVEAQIESLPEDTKRRVQDFLITQGQADRLTAAEAKPLTALYNAMARERGLLLQDLEGRRAMVNSMLGLVEKDTQRKLQALELGTKLAGLGAETETELAGKAFEQATAVAKAPTVIGSAEEGRFQWNPETKSFERITEAVTKEPETTTDIKNYEYAKQQGFTGSFEEWKNTGKAGGILSQSQQNKFAIAGVPNNIALHIQTNLNQGATVQELKDGLAKDLGDANLASQYVDKFMETAQKSSADDLVGLLQQLSNL